MVKNKLAGGFCLAWLFLVAPVVASETTWLGVTSNWNNSDNWTNGVPDASTDAFLTRSGTTPIINGSIAQVRDLHIDSLNLRIAGGGRLEAVNVTGQVGANVLDEVVVTGPGSEFLVSGNMSLINQTIPSDSFRAVILRVEDGGLLQVAGNLDLGDLPIGTIGPRSGNLYFRGEDSVVDVGGDLNLAIRSDGFYLFAEGTLRVGGRMTVAAMPQAGPSRSAGIELGRISQGFDLWPAPRLDLTGDDPAIELLNQLSESSIRFVYSDEEFRFENSSGVPISLRGLFDVFHATDGHTIADGHHEFNVWRIEMGSTEFNGSVDGLVEVLPGRWLYSSAEIARVNNAGFVQPGRRTEAGTMTITDEYVQTGSGVTHFRVEAAGFDRLVSANTIDFQGGQINVLISEDAPDGEFTLIEATVGLLSSVPAIEIVNESNLRVETTVTATQLRLNLTRTGELSLNTSSLDFGQVPLGEFSEQTLTLNNIGDSDLQIHFQPPAEASFSLSGGSCPLQFAFLLAPEQVCEVSIRFQPDRGGAIADSLMINLPLEGENQAVELQGQGLAGPDIFSDRFENQP